MTIHIVPNVSLKECFDESMATIRASSPPSTQHSCPHCGLVIQLPLMVRQQDLDDFSYLMRRAQEVMDRNGVLKHLIAELHTSIALAVAKRGPHVPD